MSNLIENSAEAAAWVDQVKATHVSSKIFGRIAGSVIWSDAKGPDGEQLVSVDPAALVADINTNGFTLLKGHDPGFPVGKVLAAQVFIGTDGARFVAAVLGLYAGNRLSFHDLGLVPIPPLGSPPLLPALTEACWINIATDPREIDSAWLDDVIRAAPLRVEWTEVSHNAADPIQELIRVGVLFMILVWNPFITTIANEAGKDVYANVHRWLRTLLRKLSERLNPVLELQSHHGECQISFMFRGNSVKRHYMAHDLLPAAAAQAEYLIANMKHEDLAPKLIVYEFHSEDGLWFPSYAELHDGRLVTDNNLLIAVERLPSGLSLGLTRSKDKPRLPTAKPLS